MMCREGILPDSDNVFNWNLKEANSIYFVGSGLKSTFWQITSCIKGEMAKLRLSYPQCGTVNLLTYLTISTSSFTCSNVLVCTSMWLVGIWWIYDNFQYIASELWTSSCDLLKNSVTWFDGCKTTILSFLYIASELLQHALGFFPYHQRSLFNYFNIKLCLAN